ncbi:MAG: DUF1934 domain-containing protein [Lachnospiraceae bacterium]|nr:DUF1934 domain-containing protein [Lachnospiraceae bacterium]
MTRNVKIIFSTLARDLSDEPQVLELIGEYTLQNGKRYLRYENDGIRTLIKITDDSVSVIYSGAMNSRMEYAPGLTTAGRLKTPEGEFETTAETDRLTVIEGSGSVLRVILHYRLSMSGTFVSKYEIEINCLKI